MENPQRVIYACAILVAGSCPVSQTLSTPSLPSSLAKTPERKRKRGVKNPVPRKKRRDETRRERERVRGVEKRRRRRWGGEKEEGGGDCAILSLLVTPLSSCRGYNATLKYRRKYKGGKGMKEWKDEIWRRRKEGKRERERESVRVSRHLSRGHTCRALLESRKGDSPAKSNPISLFLSPSPSPITRATTGGTLKRDKLEPPFRTKPTLFLSLSFELRCGRQPFFLFFPPFRAHLVSITAHRL